MSKAEKVAALKARVQAVKNEFEKHPTIKWWAGFNSDNPDLDPHKVRNVYYLNSTDEQITSRLEAHLAKYEHLTRGENG